MSNGGVEHLIESGDRNQRSTLAEPYSAGDLRLALAVAVDPSGVVGVRVGGLDLLVHHLPQVATRELWVDTQASGSPAAPIPIGTPVVCLLRQ